MSLLAVVAILILIGFGLYAINRWVTMDARVKTILNFVVIFAVCIWLVVQVLMPLIKRL